MSIWDSDVLTGVMIILLGVGGFIGAMSVGSYLFTGNPLTWVHGNQDANNPCGEGIHITHNGQPVANIAIKQLGQGTYTWGLTNSTGYAILSICNPVGAIVTFQATDYGFQLEPHQIIEAKL
jgi:hypothetical protein